MAAGMEEVYSPKMPNCEPGANFVLLDDDNPGRNHDDIVTTTIFSSTTPLATLTIPNPIEDNPARVSGDRLRSLPFTRPYEDNPTKHGTGVLVTTISSGTTPIATLTVPIFEDNPNRTKDDHPHTVSTDSTTIFPIITALPSSTDDTSNNSSATTEAGAGAVSLGTSTSTISSSSSSSTTASSPTALGANGAVSLSGSPLSLLVGVAGVALWLL